MKVKDLVTALGKLDQDLEVYGYTEDEALATRDRPFRVFFVDSIDVNVAELFRDKNHSPGIRFGDGDNSRRIVFVNLTTDF